MFNAKQRTYILWIMNVMFIGFFTVNSLGTCIVAALVGIDWPAMTVTKKFVVVTVIVVNWSTMMMAYLNRSISHLLGDPANAFAFVNEPPKTEPK